MSSSILDHAVVSKTFSWSMFRKEVKHLKKRTGACCDSAVIDMTIPLAFTQAPQIQDMNAKGKVVPSSLEKKVECR